MTQVMGWEYKANNTRLKTEPWGTPHKNRSGCDYLSSTETDWIRRHKGMTKTNSKAVSETPVAQCSLLNQTGSYYVIKHDWGIAMINVKQEPLERNSF